MMVRFSPAGAFCASALLATNPVIAQSAQAANPRRVNMQSSPIRLGRDSIRLATPVKTEISTPTHPQSLPVDKQFLQRAVVVAMV
jgi:hypothetical protein